MARCPEAVYGSACAGAMSFAEQRGVVLAIEPIQPGDVPAQFDEFCVELSVLEPPLWDKWHLVLNEASEMLDAPPPSRGRKRKR